MSAEMIQATLTVIDLKVYDEAQKQIWAVGGEILNGPEQQTLNSQLVFSYEVSVPVHVFGRLANELIKIAANFDYSTRSQRKH